MSLWAEAAAAGWQSNGCGTEREGEQERVREGKREGERDRRRGERRREV